MFLTLEDIRILSDEIKDACEGGLVQKVSLILPVGLQLTVRSKKKTSRLIFFDSPHFPSIVGSKNSWDYLSKENSPFLQILKKYIKENVITGINQIGNDRIVSLSFEECSLLIECVERFANIILLDKENRILASDKELRSPLKLHQVYSLPPALIKSKERLIKDTIKPSAEVLVRIKNIITEQGKLDAIRKVTKEIKKKRDLLEKFTRELEEGEKSESIKRKAELLKRVVHTIPFGACSVEVVDYDSYPPQNLIIQIDPKIHPKMYVENLFNRYKKLKRSMAEISSRIEITKAEIVKLLNKKEKLEKEDFKPAVELHLKPKNRKREESSGPRTFNSSDGLTIFVARNIEQGEKIVRQAKSNDLWLHVLNSPGPHVIVQRLSRKPIPHKTVIEAAALAIYFSPIRKQGKGEVSAAERRYLKFVKGVAGKVTYSRSETVSVKVDEEKLKFILSSGIDPSLRS